MRLCILLPYLSLVLAAPGLQRQQSAPIRHFREYDTMLIERPYIVKVKSGRAAFLFRDTMQFFGSEADRVYRSVFHGFATRLNDNVLEIYRHHPNVDYIEQDAAISVSSYETQTNPPWGLARISHWRAGVNEYVYDDSAGRGTCTYVLDTGIDDSHPEFEGRAKQIASFVPNQWKDTHGHGTHVAGTIGSLSYGVAKKTEIYGIKVISDEGTGSISSLIAGMDLVAKDAQRRRCPGGVLINISLAGPYSQAVNNAAAGLVEKGYFVAVAAGNHDADAANYSPASEASVCTVGGTALDDTRYDQSNWGKHVDIMAPAVDVVSLKPGGSTAFSTGTSMATPHITGLAAYLASLLGERASQSLCKRIQQLASRSMIRDQDGYTPNLLAYNGNPPEVAST